jgi:outer membrane protein assembly factor BamB
VCGGTDNIYYLAPHIAGKQNLETVSGDKLKGLSGTELYSETFKSYSYYIDDNDKLAIYDVTHNNVIARYELTDRMESKLSYEDIFYAIIDNRFYIAPYTNLIDGSYSFTDGLDIGTGPHSVRRSINGDIYVKTPDVIYSLNKDNNLLEEFLTLNFNSSIVVIDDDKAVVMERNDDNLSYLYELDIESGSLTQIMSSSSKMFSAVNFNNKVFINDGDYIEQTDAKIYDIDTSELETIENAIWSYHGLGLSEIDNGIILMKRKMYDGEKDIPGTVSVYDTNTGKESFSYGEFSEPLLYVGWYHQNYQLAIDHDVFRLYLIDLDQADSLEIVYESGGRLSRLF